MTALHINAIQRDADLERQVEYWRELAAYLASCHAATAEGLAHLSRTSKYERKRHADICAMAATGLEGKWAKKHTYNQRDEVKVALDRCRDAADMLTNAYKAQA